MLNHAVSVVRTGLVAVCLLVTGMSVAGAQELNPEALELARQYVGLTDRARVYEKTVVKMGVTTMRSILSTNPEIAEQTEEVIGDVIKTYADRKSELVDQFARIYAARFTPEELQAIIDFYTTPAGVKLLGQGIGINRDITAVLKVFENNLSREFFAKVRAGLTQKGIEI